MNRDEFIKRWRVHLAGLALYGVATEALGGPIQRAARAIEIPGEVERLLGLMFDSMAQQAQQPVQSPNGHVNGVSKPVARQQATK